MVRAVRSNAGVIITPHATTSLAPACVLLAGEGLTAKRVAIYFYFLLLDCHLLVAVKLQIATTKTDFVT